MINKIDLCIAVKNIINTKAKIVNTLAKQVQI